MTIARLILLCVLLALVGFGLAVWQGVYRVPPAWNPWAPLDVQQPPNLLTGHKLRRLQDDPALCRLALDSAELRYTPMPDSLPDPTCPLTNTVRIEASALRFSAPFRATCSLAVAYALFETHDLRPAAEAHLGSPLVRLDHFGSFACRNIARSNRRSQHATANALDIAGFHLADGRRITVARHWSGDDPEARFLRAVRDGACRRFRATLGPDYNAAHHDHLHVDMGRFGICR